MITGLPAYRPPVAEPVRCECGQLYAVYTGWDEMEAEEYKQNARAAGARFVFARWEPFLTCECGRPIDVSIDGSLMVM